MDELNLQEIENKLNTEFENGQRLIFWYDASASFEDQIDHLNLKDAKILRLTDRNMFRTKIRLEHEDTEGKYLIYAPFEKPDLEHNHLEDTLLYSKEFYTDKLSLVAAEIKLPARLRQKLDELKVFFGAEKVKINATQRKAANQRTNDFISRAQEMDMTSADADTISLIAMCVIAKARSTTVDDLFYAVFSYGDIMKQEIIGEFEKNGLNKTFWTICGNRFGYNDNKASLLRFITSLFVVYSFHDNLNTLPMGWKIFCQDSMKNRASNTVVLLDNMMNNIVYQNQFDALSGIVETLLNAKEELKSVPMEILISLSAFKCVDAIILKWLVDRITAEDRNAKIGNLTIPEICEKRQRMHFGSLYTAEYEVVRSAYFLSSAVSYEPRVTLKELIEDYQQESYKYDTAYRKFIYWYDRIEDKTDFEELRDLIFNIYSTKFLEKLIYQWNTAYQDNNFHQVIPQQSHFYYEKVAPVKEKLVVIISDAFRYEAAVELKEKLAADQNCTVTMNTMMGTLPSVTSIGMAELLPHQKLTLSGGDISKVFLDGMPTMSTEQRSKVLLKENIHSGVISPDTVMEMKAADLRAFTTGKEVIYVYHNNIDATGEALATEKNVFEAVQKTIDELYNVVKKFARCGNAYRVVITADHGFIYTRKSIEETDKLENEAGREAIADRRFIIANEDLSKDGVFAVPLGNSLNNDDPRFIMLAKGMSVFKCGGGMNYVHGGSSPQELIIPVLFVKTKKGIVETEDVSISLIGEIHRITTQKKTLSFFQKEPVSDKIKAVTYRIFFTSNEGELISNEVYLEADSKSEKTQDRIYDLKFEFHRQQYDSDNRYFLKVVNDKTGQEVLSQQVIMDLPFTDDFGF